MYDSLTWAAQVRFFGGSNKLKKLIPLSIYVLSVAFDTLHFLMTNFREIYRNCSIGELSFDLSVADGI